MNTWRWIFAAAALFGLACGPFMLESAAGASPPIGWEDVPFAFLGSLVAVLFVIGFQIVRTAPTPSRWALRFSAPIAAWLTASGVSAALVALVSTGGVAPHSLFLLAVALGFLAGVLLCYAIFRRKFSSAL
jgi:hypothetical protein